VSIFDRLQVSQCEQPQRGEIIEEEKNITEQEKYQWYSLSFSFSHSSHVLYYSNAITFSYDTIIETDLHHFG